jgi:hypothetical protein
MAKKGGVSLAHGGMQNVNAGLPITENQSVA